MVRKWVIPLVGLFTFSAFGTERSVPEPLAKYIQTLCGSLADKPQERCKAIAVEFFKGWGVSCGQDEFKAYKIGLAETVCSSDFKSDQLELWKLDKDGHEPSENLKCTKAALADLRESMPVVNLVAQSLCKSTRKISFKPIVRPLDTPQFSPFSVEDHCLPSQRCEDVEENLTTLGSFHAYYPKTYSKCVLEFLGQTKKELTRSSNIARGGYEAALELGEKPQRPENLRLVPNCVPRPATNLQLPARPLPANP